MGEPTKGRGGHPGAKFVARYLQQGDFTQHPVMISLQDDSGEPDFEELAARLTAKSGIPWSAGDVKMWSGIFGALKPDTEPDEGND